MAVTITVNISDHNEKVLLHDLTNINTWVQAAVDGKINNCGKRMAIEATSVLKADDSVTSMPATDQGLQEALLARAGYKNRAQRDAE